MVRVEQEWPAARVEQELKRLAIDAWAYEVKIDQRGDDGDFLVTVSYATIGSITFPLKYSEESREWHVPCYIMDGKTFLYTLGWWQTVHGLEAVATYFRREYNRQLDR